MPRLKVAAVISADPGPHELWTLRHLSFVACELSVARQAPAADPPVAADDRAALDEYFDCDDLRAWWARSEIATASEAAQDVVVRIFDGKPGPWVMPRPTVAALTMRHEKNSVCIIDEGIDQARILWRGAPQLAPGDASLDIFFRAHLEATRALVQIVKTYASVPGGDEC